MTRPKPRLDVTVLRSLETTLTDQSAHHILADLGVEADTELITEIKLQAASVAATFELEQQQPSTVEQAEGLRRLQTHLQKLELSRHLGPQQRQDVAKCLSRRERPVYLRQPLRCFNYLRDNLAVWLIYHRLGKVPLPRRLASPVRRSSNLLFRLDDYAIDAMFNSLVSVMRAAPPLPRRRDPIMALEYCRDRLLSAIEVTLPQITRRGAPRMTGVHTAVSQLAAVYENITGKSAVYWEIDSFESHPFYGFVTSMLDAAGHPQPAPTIKRAIELHCRHRNKRVRKHQQKAHL